MRGVCGSSKTRTASSSASAPSQAGGEPPEGELGGLGAPGLRAGGHRRSTARYWTRRSGDQELRSGRERWPGNSGGSATGGCMSCSGGDGHLR
jgi:hypothetical protein